MTEKKDIKAGEYITIRSHYSNGMDEAVWEMMKNGLIIHSKYKSDIKHGRNWETITFKATRHCQVPSHFPVIDVLFPND